MSLRLTLKITPGKTNWVATAMLREDAEDSNKEIYCQTGNKIDKYSKRITGKTKKSLAKLARWETKIKALL